jgi:hypothetical protein
MLVLHLFPCAHSIFNTTLKYFTVPVVPYVSAKCQLARDMAITEKVSGGGQCGAMGARSISPETRFNDFSERTFITKSDKYFLVCGLAKV